METGAENCHITEREMVVKSCCMKPRTQLKLQDQQSDWEARKRWEDDINEFLKLVEDETENFIESSSQINKTWINTAEDRGRWTLLEENYTMTSEERHEYNTRMRRNSHNIPAGYDNGVKLTDEEVANIT